MQVPAQHRSPRASPASVASHETFWSPKTAIDACWPTTLWMAAQEAQAASRTLRRAQEALLDAARVDRIKPRDSARFAIRSTLAALAWTPPSLNSFPGSAGFLGAFSESIRPVSSPSPSVSQQATGPHVTPSQHPLPSQHADPKKQNRNQRLGSKTDTDITQTSRFF